MIRLLSTTSSVVLFLLLLTVVITRTHCFQSQKTDTIRRIDFSSGTGRRPIDATFYLNHATINKPYDLTRNKKIHRKHRVISLRAIEETNSAEEKSQFASLDTSSFPIITSSLPTPLLVPSSTTTAAAVLSPWEDWCIQVIETKYDQALRIKCPFFKRRAADLLDAADMILRFLVIRHKSLLPPPAGWSIRDSNDVSSNTKLMNLPIEDIIEILKHDWRTDTNKGYYITGRITKSIFRDDCYFDGPDPDMPVRGLRKYLNAASQLFEHKTSSAQLLSINILDNNNDSPFSTDASNNIQQPGPKAIICNWKMSGVLRLPWKPIVPEIHGSTIYYLDENNLIYQHIETWEESTFQAFLQTFWPEMANQIRWKKKSSQQQQPSTVSR